jgi:hypothetical protein
MLEQLFDPLIAVSEQCEANTSPTIFAINGRKAAIAIKGRT